MPFINDLYKPYKEFLQHFEIFPELIDIIINMTLINFEPCKTIYPYTINNALEDLRYTHYNPLNYPIDRRMKINRIIINLYKKTNLDNHMDFVRKIQKDIQNMLITRDKIMNNNNLTLCGISGDDSIIYFTDWLCSKYPHKFNKTTGLYNDIEELSYYWFLRRNYVETPTTFDITKFRIFVIVNVYVIIGMINDMRYFRKT